MFLVFVISYFLLTHLIIYPIDNAHFYRANFFWGEPRIALDWYTSIDFSAGAGQTHHSHNSEGQKSKLLSIYGPESMQVLGKNVPNLNPNDPLDILILDLLALPQRKNFATLEFDGTFSTVEGIINWYQNITNGFFFQMHFPIRQLTISNIHYTDLSPDDTIRPNKNTPAWISFLQNIDAILNQHRISIKKSSRAGIGDLSFLGGWAGTYFDTVILDYIDVDAKIGVLFPTGKTRDIRNPFELPLGYNGHYGMPLKFDVAFGAFEWITIGSHIGALFLFDRTTNIRIKTSEQQQGFIFLATEKAKIKSGTLWDMSAYVKADHFCKGLSVLLGYSYNQKDHDEIKHVHHTFDLSVANKDLRFKGWIMHVLNVIVEYDFSKYREDIGPRAALWYNHVLSGKRIFDTNILSGAIGLDIEWYF